MSEPSSPPWPTRFRLEAAKIRLVQGQSEEVIQLLTPELPGDPSPDSAAQRLSLLALAYARKGEPLPARKFMEEATQVRGVSLSETAEIFASRARLEQLENNSFEAKSLLEKSLISAHAAGNRFAEAAALLNLSVLHLHQSRYEDALEQADASARIAKSIDAQVLFEKALGNAGWAYYGTGDYPRALNNFNAAAASAAGLGSTIDEEIWNNTAGMSEVRIGNLDGARRHFERALTLARSMKNASEITDVDHSLALLFLRNDDLQKSRPYLDEARQLAQQTGDSSAIQFGALLEAQFAAREGRAAQAATLLSQVVHDAKEFPATYLEAEHTLAQVHEESGDSKDAELWFQRSIATYRNQRSALLTDDARLPFFENGREIYADYVTFLIRSHRPDQALAVLAQGRAETLAEGLGLNDRTGLGNSLSLTALARRSRSVILVYGLTSQGTYLWAANGKQSGFYRLPDREAILAAVASHRRAVLAARDPLQQQDPAARKLYDMLIQPAGRLIHPGDRISIVAGDGLNGLNFETLLTPSSRYWIEDVTITNLASVRLLLRSPDPQPANAAAADRRLLVIGDPVYTGEAYAPLPHAADEVQDVAAHFPAAERTVVTGRLALPEAYRQSRPAQFRYIHFVSHAVASELVPLDSAVVLSAQGSPDTAKLYAREILSRPLHASLVTISACQGSGVRAYAGEGLVGLAWAFLRAGSHNVIGALWDVSDASTPQLMSHLYDGIAAGQPPDAALRAAKLEMLHGQGVFRKPLYWGAFQLYSAGESPSP